MMINWNVFKTVVQNSSTRFFFFFSSQFYTERSFITYREFLSTLSVQRKIDLDFFEDETATVSGEGPYWGGD